MTETYVPGPEFAECVRPDCPAFHHQYGDRLYYQWESAPAGVHQVRPELEEMTSAVGVLLTQVRVDRKQSVYWRERPGDLDSVEAYLESVRDHLAAVKPADNLAAIRQRDAAAVARLGNPDPDPLLRAEMDRRWLLAKVDELSNQLTELATTHGPWPTEVEAWGILERHAEYRIKQDPDDPWAFTGIYACICGEEFPAQAGMGGAHRGHRLHQAQAIAR